jgi:single-strand DNA-binding protein
LNEIWFLGEIMYQSTSIIGRLGNDPELRFLPSGDGVTTFSVATDRTYTKDGEKQKETTWFRVSVFGKMAEACNTYLAKGKLVFVEGQLRSDPKTGGPVIFEKQDGSASASFEVRANQVKFLSPSDRQE